MGETLRVGDFSGSIPSEQHFTIDDDDDDSAAKNPPQLNACKQTDMSREIGGEVFSSV